MRKSLIQKKAVDKKTLNRFRGGSLLMLSRKTTVSGKIPYFIFRINENVSIEQNLEDNNEIDVSLSFPLEETAKELLDRGIPILIFETPILVKRDFSQSYKDRYYWRSKQQKPGKFWQVKFMLNERLCVMFLTEKQYNHELVKAVPARLEKDYSKNKRS